MNFSELGVPENFVTHLNQKGISSPSLIQELSYEPISSGRSVVALSKTGTGKTLAYLLPLFIKIMKAKNDAVQKSGLGQIVLVPTRELAYQVQDTLQFLSQLSPQKSVVVIGGEAEEAQVRNAKDADWLVATPGRLLDLIERKLVDVQNVKTLVFDEADRILDMGFIDDVRVLLKYLPKPVSQMLFFSATLHFGIEELAYEFGVEFEKIGVAQDELTVEGLDHEVAFVGDDEKFHALCQFLNQRKGARGIVFSNYRERAHELSRSLRSLGAPAEGLSAQLNQSQRQKIMEAFRAEKIQILVASDLAARGLDVQDLDFVVNFDLPEDPATYVHRVGRTARAGKSGIALSFVGFNDSFRLEGIEKFLGKKIERFHFETEHLKGPLPSWGAPKGHSAGDAPRPHAKSKPHAGPRHSPRKDTPPASRPPRQHFKPRIVAPLSVATKPHTQHKPSATPQKPSGLSKLFWALMGKLGLEKAPPKQKHSSSKDTHARHKGPKRK